MNVRGGTKRIAKILIATEKSKSTRLGKTSQNIANAKVGTRLNALTKTVDQPLAIMWTGVDQRLFVASATRCH